ncbi:MAG: valine--tRNA ligase [Bacteroidota bacterium]
MIENIPTKYNPLEIESKWYMYWLENKLFKSMPDDREAYTVVIPPPNVTGVLHMGHMLNNTIQDILVRRARMLGKNACWVPGTDHASIATEAKVVAKLKADGIDKKNLSRADFLKHAWEWKDKHGGIILDQLKKLGASCDWDRTKFTMDDDLSESVIDVFIDLYNKGFIYRGVRMVNWDPKALTALSDEEVIHKEVQSKLWYIKYQIEGTSDEWITIATTRPETILGDTAICVHPNDPRYAYFKGKKALVPLINRAIPIIYDEYVEMEFGTGALKVTPAHDINDYNLGNKHKLDTIDIFNPNGTLNENAILYVNEDRFVVRNKISKELDEKGHIVKIEQLTNNVGYSERTDEVIEPKLSMQWFCDMQKLAKPALENVMNDNIKFHPPKFKNLYNHWMENVRDWCISRQLWWGQQIPAFYLPNREIVVAKSIEEAVKLANTKFGTNYTAADLKQDEDVLDTWFSSWLWPISVFDGIRNPNNADINYYYPTNDLVTAPEILFFWVARMIMAGYEYKGDLPFKNVYLTGIVRDKQGRKMSKSLGNSPDPILLMDKFGADGVRMGMLFSSPAGNDLPFDESMCEQGRNFCNKLWNAFRLITSWETKHIDQPDYAKVSIQWFDAKLNQSIAEIEDLFEKFRISDALLAMYRLIWDDFCSWYLEMIKPAYQQPIDEATLKATIAFLEKILQIAHPFMPFITEELWHHLGERMAGESIMTTAYPKANEINKDIISKFEYATEVINSIRNIRKEKNIPMKEELFLSVKKNNNEAPQYTFDNVVVKLCNLSEIGYTANKIDESISFRVRNTEFFIPMEEGTLDVEAEIQKLSEELKYTEGFLKSVMGKLSNEKFVNNAPEQVLAIEQKKKADAEARIKVIAEQLNRFKKH